MTMETKNNSISRNLIIFLCALGVVAGTHVLKFAAAEESESGNIYLKIIREEEYTDDIADAEDAADGAIMQYHVTVNEMFNKRIEGMVALGNTGNPEDLKKMIDLITPPPMELDENNLPVKRKSCDSDAEHYILSTYCLAKDATNEYFLFREAMIETRRSAREQAATKFKAVTGQEAGSADSPDILFEQKNIFGAAADLVMGEKSLQGYGEVLNRIDRELDIARQSLDQALATYSELQMALPLHQKYLKVIGALESYRDKISDIRREIDLYPSTFLDVTTTQCN